MMFATCNPIAAELTEVYGISPFIVSLSSNGFLLMHPLLTFLQTYIVNKYSASLSIRIGCALTLLGALIRTLTTYT
jgi:FLVCR family feline leukemia virus subgroup C receptor-related protein